MRTPLLALTGTLLVCLGTPLFASETQAPVGFTLNVGANLTKQAEYIEYGYINVWSRQSGSRAGENAATLRFTYDLSQGSFTTVAEEKLRTLKMNPKPGFENAEYDIEIHGNGRVGW